MGETPTGFAPESFKQAKDIPLVLLANEGPIANEASQNDGRIKKALKVLHRNIIAPLFRK